MAEHPDAETSFEIRSINLWRVPLDANYSEESAAVLSPDEQARADRLKIPQIRQRFINGRLTLRRILAAQLGQHPAELRFEYAASGKPFLAGMPLHFNFTHSGDLGLLAVADIPVGVDLEQQRSVTALRTMEATILMPEEQQRLDHYIGDERDALLLRLWTCKEALVKATGEGFQAMLRYQLRWDQSSGQMTAHDAQGDAIPWAVQPLTIHNAYTAAIAAASPAGTTASKLKLQIIERTYPSELKTS